MASKLLRLGEQTLTFLLGTGGAVFVGALFLAALVGLIRARSIKMRAVCIVLLLFCLLYAGLLIWLSAGFGGSGGHTPVPTGP